MATIIKWRSDFYDWQPVDPDFFLPEDYVSIVGDVNLVRIDPKWARLSMYESKTIRYPGDFVLYQCDSPSAIRKNIPIRFFYSKKFGKAYELKGANAAIYSMMEFINDSLAEEVSAWFSEPQNLWNYVKFFFDNVKGRHGRFEIAEDIEEMKERIEVFYWYDFVNSSDNRISQNTFQDSDLKSIEEDVLMLFNQHNQQSLDEVLFRNLEKGADCVFPRVLMVFKDSLFISEVTVKRTGKDFGVVSLGNDKMVDTEYLSRLRQQT